MYGTVTRGIILLGAITLFASAALAKETKPVPKMPVQIVSDLLGPYMIDGNHQLGGTPAIAKVATPELARLVNRDDNCIHTRHEICRLDFDPIIWGQDWEIRNFTMRVENNQADQQSVFVEFYNWKWLDKIRYDFVRIESRWLLSDIQGLNADDEKESLLQILKRRP